MTAWFDPLIRCVYPPVCAICRAPCRPVSGYPAICRVCLAKMPLIRPPDDIRSWPEIANPDVLPGDQIFASMIYDEPIRSALIRLKFFDEKDIAELVAALMVRLAQKSRIRAKAVMAVPLHPLRLRERGYNQSGLIAAALARRLSLPDGSDMLIRTRATPQQSLLDDRRFRQNNVAGAFAFYPEKRRLSDMGLNPGDTIWLVDDILTTGATLTESARPLWQAGLHVQGLVAALAAPPRPPVLNRT